MLKILVPTLIAGAALSFWLAPLNPDDRITARDPLMEPPAAVGTAGTHEGSAETLDGSVVTEIETITGANDGMMLVGRRVDLHVEVQQRANDEAFWVGPRDNRVLVVLGRDQSGHGISPLRGGQRAAISGVVRPVPHAEQRSSWRLTEADEKELADRKIYIRADTVSSEGHGRSF